MMINSQGIILEYTEIFFRILVFSLKNLSQKNSNQIILLFKQQLFIFDKILLLFEISFTNIKIFQVQKDCKIYNKKIVKFYC